MVGVLIVSHGTLAETLVNTAEFIVGKLKAVKAVSIDPTSDVKELREKIHEAMEEVDGGNGVLILTDMFGGTPSNISLSFLEKERIDVVTGVNLPMVINLAHVREGKSLPEVAEAIRSGGRRSISLASQILGKKGA